MALADRNDIHIAASPSLCELHMDRRSARLPTNLYVKISGIACVTILNKAGYTVYNRFASSSLSCLSSGQCLFEVE